MQSGSNKIYIYVYIFCDFPFRRRICFRTFSPSLGLLWQEAMQYSAFAHYALRLCHSRGTIEKDLGVNLSYKNIKNYIPSPGPLRYRWEKVSGVGW